MAEAVFAVCAVINHPENKNLYLGVSRKNDHTAMGLVGGKIDSGETPEEALKREVKEETGLIVTSLQFIFADNEYTAPGHGSVASYVCEVEGEIIQPENEGKVAWVSIEDLFAGPFGIYNKRLFEKLTEKNF